QRRLVMSEVCHGFDSVDDFIRTARTITNRRKSRAGHALENHFEHHLQQEGVRFEAQPIIDDTRPDILVPGSREYLDQEFDVEKKSTRLNSSHVSRSYAVCCLKKQVHTQSA